MKWLGRLIVRIIQNSQDVDEKHPRTGNILATTRADDVDGDDRGLNITVRSAVGGRIVSFRHHESKTDRYSWKTYVVPDDLDFEKELGKMITLESMRM